MDEFLFPYPKVRPVQEALVNQVYSIIENKYNLITHAPTGLGKTAATLSPALAQALKKDLTIFFLTPRHSQHNIAIETLKQIKQKYNLDFRVVDFIGKKWMCQIPGIELLGSSEFTDYCRDARKNDYCEYYLNMKKKVKKDFTIRQIPSIAHVEEVCKICSENKMCPFEMSCLLAKDAKVIIADYFHILSPSIRATLLQKTNKKLENCVIIFDEAHNLPDKCRDLLSVNISTITVDRAVKEAKKFNFKFISQLNAIKNVLSNITLPLDKTEILIKKEDFLVDEDFTAELKLSADIVREEQKKSFIGSIAHFLESWIGPDHGFIRVLSRNYTKRGVPFINLSYKCLDPSFIFKDINPHSMILMSGTLSPTQMYADLLGIKLQNTMLIEYKSPFPVNNRLNLIVPNISTKFTKRSEEMYEKIAKNCSKITNLIPGSVAIFFPSYELRDNVNKYFQALCEKTIFFEDPRLNKAQKQELIENFKKYKEKGAVLLGTASGSLGEGIDLPNLLKAVIVVGLPLAKPDLETQQLIEYYDDRYKKGWDYGYIYPAIIKSLQNAGRCIRSETDKGVIVFLDERYTWKNYSKCFPPDLKIETVTKPEDKIKEFFK